LGATLPPSYRDFLKISNGWRQTGTSIWRVWSTEEVDWFPVRNREWIDAYLSPFTFAELNEALVLTDDEYLVYGAAQGSRALPDHVSGVRAGDQRDRRFCDLLAQSRDLTPDGEWEAWLFANWLPGAQRHGSFAELMQAEHKSFRELG
jgi:hypothetical protein